MEEAQAECGRITLIKVENVSWERISVIDLNRYMILAFKKRITLFQKSFYKIGPRACTIKLFFLSQGAAR